MAILMAGQLVIPDAGDASEDADADADADTDADADAGDASEDGGNPRFSRQSLGLVAWRTWLGEDIHRQEKLEGTRFSLLLPAYLHSAWE